MQHILTKIRLRGFVYVIFTFILLFSELATAQNAAQKGTYSYRKGNEFYEQKKFREAISFFDQAIDSLNGTNPKPTTLLVKAYNNRGNAYGQLNNYLFALFDYNKAIDMDKKLIDSYLNRANVQTLLGNFTDAVADLNKVILLNSQQYEAYYQRGLIFLLDLEQFEAAEKDLKIAAEKLKTQPEPANYYALVLYELKKYKEALLAADKAVTLQKDYADAYYVRAMIFFAQKDKEKASKDIEKALALQPATPEYLSLKKKIGN